MNKKRTPDAKKLNYPQDNESLMSVYSIFPIPFPFVFSPPLPIHTLCFPNTQLLPCVTPHPPPLYFTPVPFVAVIFKCQPPRHLPVKPEATKDASSCFPI